MKNSIIWEKFLTVALGVAVVGLGSCTSAPNETATVDTSDEPEAELQVVTTFLPITQFTKAVAGDRATVEQLLPPSSGPHDYQATPATVQTMAEADVLVKNGLEMELFLEDLIANADNPDLATIDSSEGISTIANAEEGHSHSHDHDHAEGHSHDHDHAEEGHHHHHGEYNPHIWLDPKRAIQQVENIRDGLIAADPEGEAEYTENAAAYIEQLQQLDADITAQLEPYQGQTFVVFHDFAPYFAESYGLESEVLVDVPAENPAPEDVKRITETVGKANLKALLTEPQAGTNTFSALAQDLNINVSTFDPIETGGAEALEPEYYLNTMRQNADNLVLAFGDSTQSVLPFWQPQPLATIPQPVSLRF